MVRCQCLPNFNRLVKQKNNHGLQKYIFWKTIFAGHQTVQYKCQKIRREDRRMGLPMPDFHESLRDNDLNRQGGVLQRALLTVHVYLIIL